MSYFPARRNEHLRIDSIGNHFNLCVIKILTIQKVTPHTLGDCNDTGGTPVGQGIGGEQERTQIAGGIIALVMDNDGPMPGGKRQGLRTKIRSEEMEMQDVEFPFLHQPQEIHEKIRGPFCGGE